ALRPFPLWRRPRLYRTICCGKSWKATLQVELSGRAQRTRVRPLERRLLCPKPGDHVAAPPADRARPVQAFERFALLARPPVFLDHHEGATARPRARASL